MNNYCMLYEKIKHICNYNYRFFLSNPTVVGIGVGFKETCGCCTCQMCITVYVRQKLASNQISPLNLIPPVYMDVPTDVIESGSISLGTCNCSCSNSPLHQRKRPFAGGYSVGAQGHPDCTAACLVKDSGDNYCILTSNHATVANDLSQVGHTTLIQPAPKYGGKAVGDTVGTISEIQHVNLGGDNNFIDAALCKTTPIMIAPGIYGIGLIKGTVPATLGMKVLKVGSGSEQTKGVIKSINVIMKVDFLGNEVLFKDQIVTKLMSKPGDEGALLINKSESKAIGLLMGQTHQITIYNNISNVLSELNIHIL